MRAIPVVASPLLGVGPALKNPAPGRPEGEPVLSRERHAIIAIGADSGDISGEDRGHSGVIKGVGKGVGMLQLPAQCERAIGSPRGLIGIAAMPKRPGQAGKGADPGVLPVAKGVIAMLVGPIQRRGRFGMLEGCRVIAAKDQRGSEDAMAHQERAGGGLRLSDGQEVGGALKRGCNSPAVQSRDPKPVKHGEMDRCSDCRCLGHEPIRSLQRGEDFGVSVDPGHQRCGQGGRLRPLTLLWMVGFSRVYMTRRWRGMDSNFWYAGA